MTETVITRAEVKKAFYDLRKQASDIPEMSLNEINAEIEAVRAERKKVSIHDISCSHFTTESEEV